MTPFHRIRRVFALPVDLDVDREIAFHIEERARELEDEGWEAPEARLEALRLFGDLDSVSARCRAITRQHRRARRRTEMFDALRQDLKYGTRTLWKNPGFTLVALATLALGVGATSAIFSVVDGVLLSPLPYPEPHRLVTLWEESERGHAMRVPEANFVDWRDHGRGFDGMAVYSGYGGLTTVLGGAVPVRAAAVPVSADFFRVLGVEPLVGRVFLDEESRFGGDPAVVVSYGFWRRHLEGSRDLGGRTLRFSGRIYRVVGVMPPGFDFPGGAELWYPSELSEPTPSRTSHNWNVIARLAPGASLDGVRAGMTSLAERIKQEYGDDVDAVGVRVTELRDELVGGIRRPLVLLLAASALVLLVAATNVASTLLARAVARQREIAVRIAIGAGRMRVVRQLLTEAVLLTTLGGLAGLGLAALLVRTLRSVGPASLPRLDEVAVDGTVLLFALTVSIVTGLVFALAPALQASRTDLRGVMSEGVLQGAKPRVWNLLVGVEVVLATVLLMGSAWLIRSFWELVSVEPGFSTEEVLTLDVTVPGIRIPDDFEFEPYRREEQKMAAFYRDFLPALAAVPGVRRVGLISHLPLDGNDPNGAFVRDGQSLEEYSSASYRVVGGDYFAAMGMPLVRGRLFDSRDVGGPHTALVNETFAERYFRDEDPLGQRIRSFGMDLWWDDWMTIVGIVGDVRHRGLDKPVSPEIYVPVEQRAFRAGSGTVVVKAAASLDSVAAALRTRLGELYPEMPVDVTAMKTIFVRSVERERFTMLLLAGFAAVALSLAAIGIYGVVSYAVAQRTRETGIRIALGAGPGNILRLMMRDSLAVVAVGVAIGWAGAFALRRTLESQLFGTSATDVTTYGAVALVLGLTALGASYVPARRSTGIDPLLAIRDE